MSAATYSMSFTSGTLLRQEALTVANTFRETADWTLTRERILAGNLLQMRTANASKRIYREVASRLKTLSPEQLDLLLEGDLEEQNYLLWLAFCLRYRFVYDFAAEVIHEKVSRLDYQLSHEDYDVFFNNKAEWHPEMDEISLETVKKQRQVVFKTLREAGILDQDDRIIPAYLSPRLAAVIVDGNSDDLVVFPIRDIDRTIMLTK